MPWTRRRFLKTGAAVAGGVAGTGAGLLALPQVQRMMVYSPEKDFAGNVLPPIKSPEEYGLKNIVAETLKTKDGNTFLTWHSNEMIQGKKTLVFFPGNAGHFGASPATGIGGMTLGDGNDAYIKLIKEAQKQGYQVMCANHVGYAGSNTNTPTEAKMYQGAEQTVDWLLEQGLAPNDLHICGFSMGTPIAAHAANHLSEKLPFQRDDTQAIRLVLVNGLIDVQEGIEAFGPPFLHYYTGLVLHDRMDTGKELEKMAASGLGNRIYATFMRGEDDPATPADQLHKQREASKGLFSHIKTVPGKHYVDPGYIMKEFQEMLGVGGRQPESRRRHLSEGLQL